LPTMHHILMRITRFCGGKGATIVRTLNYSDTDIKDLTGNLGLFFFWDHRFHKIFAVEVTKSINISYLDWLGNNPINWLFSRRWIIIAFSQVNEKTLPFSSPTQRKSAYQPNVQKLKAWTLETMSCQTIFYEVLRKIFPWMDKDLDQQSLLYS